MDMPGSGRDQDGRAVDMDSYAARETARQKRRAERQKQERQARPPSEQQVEYDRELDGWIASHGSCDSELDRPAWKAVFDKARRKERDRLRHQKHRLAQQQRSRLAQQPRSSLETMVDDVWHQVVSRLSERDLVAVACTCTAIRNHEAVARELAKVWAVYQAVNMFIGALAASDGEERRRRRVAAGERAEAARVARASHPRGTVVHGAPIAHGVPPLAAADYEVRVVVETPANNRDDFMVGKLKEGTNEFVVSSIGQPHFGRTFTRLLGPSEPCGLAVPPALVAHGVGGAFAHQTFQAGVARLRTHLAAYEHNTKRKSN